MYFEKKGVSLTYKIILCEIWAAVIINMILNFIWARLIMKGLIRAIRRPGIEQSFDGKDESKEIEVSKILDPNQPKSDGNLV